MTRLDFIDGEEIEIQLNPIERLLKRLKLINLDFRSAEFKESSELQERVNTGVVIVMMTINVLFVLYDFARLKDDYDEQEYTVATNDDAHSKTVIVRTYNGMFSLPSNVCATLFTILLHFVVKDGKCNRRFMINVKRSQLIAIVQVPFQFTSLMVMPDIEFGFYLLLFQVTFELFVFMAYQRVWAKVESDTKVYKTIRYTSWSNIGHEGY